MSFAMVFPGQGSQSVGMLAELAKQFPVVAKTFQQASSVLDYDLWQLVAKGPSEQLNQTEYTQPALLAADIAVWRCWQQVTDARPSVLAGHSLGEYAALVAGQALTFTDAVQLVEKRGRYMQQAVAAGEGAMAAIIGLDDQQVSQLCEQIKQGDEVLTPANFNAIGQVVVAGHRDAVNRLLAAAKPAGAKLAKLIPVSVPSHCALMQSAAAQLAKDLQQLTLQSPLIPVISNVDVEAIADSTHIADLLTQQLTHCVHWVKTIEKMQAQGVSTIIECGPGKVLTGLNKRISKQIHYFAMHEAETINQAVEHLTGEISCH